VRRAWYSAVMVSMFWESRVQSGRVEGLWNGLVGPREGM